MPNQLTHIFVGTAGWSIPRTSAESFPVDGSHLERYAQVLPCAEINSSFYRPHKPRTYERWAQSVPEHFRFAVKMPQSITHGNRLRSTQVLISRFLDEATALGSKLGPLLVQLPPSLRFDSVLAGDFFACLRSCFEGDVVCEPRHMTWFTPEAEQLLANFRVARVAADPALTREAREPGGWSGLVYHRLHGSPRIYYSEYSAEYLVDESEKILTSSEFVRTWCIFDNTAGFAATGNALSVFGQLRDEFRKEENCAVLN